MLYFFVAVYWSLGTVETFQFVCTPPRYADILQAYLKSKLSIVAPFLTYTCASFIFWTCTFCQLTRAFRSHLTRVFVFSLHVYQVFIRLQLTSSDYACFLLVAVYFEILLWYLSLIICQGPKYCRLLSVVPRCWICLSFITGYSRSLSIPLISEVYPFKNIGTYTWIFSFSLKSRSSKQLHVFTFLKFPESRYIYVTKADKILHQFCNTMIVAAKESARISQIILCGLRQFADLRYWWLIAASVV